MVGEVQAKVLGFLVAYLERQMELGRLRAHNTRSIARSLFGSLIFYMLSREVHARRVSEGPFAPDRKQPRRLRPPASLQQALFPYGEAWG